MTDFDAIAFGASCLMGGQILAYLIGSIPFGLLVARAVRGVDIRTIGSGNIGATNVGRLLGLRWFLVVFALDCGKGVAAVGLGAAAKAWLAMRGPTGEDAGFYLPVAMGFAVIVGHVASVFLRFRGGKGVATSLGVVAMLTPLAASVGLVAWLILAAITRMVSFASLGFGLIYLLAHFTLTTRPLPPERPNTALDVFVVVVVLVLFVAHRTNIKRMISGTENQFSWPGRKSAATTGNTTDAPPDSSLAGPDKGRANDANASQPLNH